MPIRIVLIVLSLLIAVACAQIAPTPTAVPTATVALPTPTSTAAPTETPAPPPTPKPTPTAIPQPTSEPTVCDADEAERYAQETKEISKVRQQAFIELGELFAQMGKDSSVTSNPRWYSQFESRLSAMETSAKLMLEVPMPSDVKLRSVHEELVRSAELMLEAIPLTKRAVDRLDAGMLKRATTTVNRSVDHLERGYRYADEWTEECQ